MVFCQTQTTGGLDRKQVVINSLSTRVVMFTKKKIPAITSYTSNPVLATVKPDWKGTPLDEDGLFINHEYPWKLDLGKIFRFIMHRNPQREIKKQDTWRITVLKDDQWLTDRRTKLCGWATPVFSFSCQVFAF